MVDTDILPLYGTDGMLISVAPHGSSLLTAQSNMYILHNGNYIIWKNCECKDM